MTLQRLIELALQAPIARDPEKGLTGLGHELQALANAQTLIVYDGHHICITGYPFRPDAEITGL